MSANKEEEEEEVEESKPRNTAAAFYSSSFLGRNSEGSPPLTHAVVPSVDLHVLRGTHAGVVAQRVVAGAGPADADVGGALVDVCKSKTVKRQDGER